MIPKYIGNGAYCYANSIAMLLADKGYDYSPSIIEVLSGLGIGFFIDINVPIVFFSNYATSPEDGINNALNLLGFTYEERSFENEKIAFEKLKIATRKGPVVIGPIDIGYMKHWGTSKDEGGDHYILVYDVTKEDVWIHDPQEFPSMPIPIKDFVNIWRADNISFKRKKFHFWTNPKRKNSKSKLEIFKDSIKLFKMNYEKSKIHPEHVKIDEEALMDLSIRTRKPLPEFLFKHLTNFAFPVIMRRSLDYADFFRENKREKLAQIKERQAELFGTCQVYSMKKNWKKVSDALKKLVKKEKEFKKELFNK
ncbi:BtrH N-terminal domain-containing protein [Candidatus Woesearchaeota archaeon]|nr:BtrH N-terminal domain-containing protein [Candidatus Woesearchaeota archaeon]